MTQPISATSPRSRFSMRRLLRRPPALFGLLVVALLVFSAAAAPWLAPHAPDAQNLAQALKPPAWAMDGNPEHLLGTDALGRDIFSRIIFGSQVSLIVGVMAVAIQGGIGVVLGLVAGYNGGVVDQILMRIVDLQLSIPFIVLALALMAVLGPSLLNVIIVLGVTGWVVYGRMVRAEVLALKGQDFVESARAMGMRDLRIMFRHVLPNAASSAIVIATLQVARMIISEASLSFLGLGVQPPTPSWGGMVADGRVYITTHWWIGFFPGLAIFITVLALNLLGDWLRDTLDPTLYN